MARLLATRHPYTLNALMGALAESEAAVSRQRQLRRRDAQESRKLMRVDAAVRPLVGWGIAWSVAKWLNFSLGFVNVPLTLGILMKGWRVFANPDPTSVAVRGVDIMADGLIIGHGGAMGQKNKSGLFSMLP